MHFASDNTAPVHPAILKALTDVNMGPAMPYGADEVTVRAAEALRATFEAPDAAVFFVTTGTAANALALSALVSPYGGVLAHQEGHINTDECAAPEFFTGGAKIIPLPGDGGRLTPDAVKAALAHFVHGPHQVKPQALSMSNATEAGCVYHPAAVRSLCAVAKEAGLKVHLDGARLANALVHAGCTPAEMTWRAGVDVLCLGATKNGAMMAEAVIFFDPALAADFDYRRKRAGQMLSKARYVSAQFLAWLQDDLWLRLARHANDMAQAIAEGIDAFSEVRLVHAVEGNEVFLDVPAGLCDALREEGAVFYDWGAAGEGHDRRIIRLVTSWATRLEEVKAFLAVMERCLAGR